MDQKQWLEIGMLLVQNADVLLLANQSPAWPRGARGDRNLLRRIGVSAPSSRRDDMDFMRRSRRR